MITQRGGSYTHRRECKLQSRIVQRLPQAQNYPRNLLSNDSNDAHHTSRHRRQSSPMYDTFKKYRICYTCSCQSLPQENHPSTFHSALFRLSLHFILLSQSYTSQTNEAKEEGWLNLAGNRWVGTGTGFCFPARECASPVGSSHADTVDTVTEGRMKKLVTRWGKTSQPNIRTQAWKDWHDFRLRKKIPSQEIKCHPSSSELSRLERRKNLEAIA